MVVQDFVDVMKYEFQHYVGGTHARREPGGLGNSSLKVEGSYSHRVFLWRANLSMSYFDVYIAKS